MIILFYSLVTNGYAQQFLVPIELEDFDYYIDSVVVDAKYEKQFGFVQRGLRKKKLSFGNEKISDVMDEYLKSNFPQRENKKPLIVTINHFNVEILDSSNVTVALSFFERKEDELYFRNTFTSNRYNYDAHERLISYTIQDCFELFVEKDNKQLNANELVQDVFYTKPIFPIQSLFLSETSKEIGYYTNLMSFQNNSIIENESVKTVKLIAKNENPYYQVFVNEKIDVKSVAVSDGEHLYFRIGRKYYRLYYDSEIHFFAHDFHMRFPRDLAIGLGTLGFLPGLALGDFNGGLIGMFVGAGVGATIYYFIQNRKNKKVVQYNLDILTGNYSKIEDN